MPRFEEITYTQTRDLPREDVVRLYRVNGWSSADKPEALCAALTGSHALVSAWHEGALLGVGNAISDGHLVVYYPHLLVTDGAAAGFYERLGFTRAGETVPMWIYDGDDH